jgi:hypothetical protein
MEKAAFFPILQNESRYEKVYTSCRVEIRRIFSYVQTDKQEKEGEKITKIQQYFGN